MTICCWPLSEVEVVPGLAAALLPVSAGGGGSSVPITWRPWSSSFTLVELRPVTGVTVLSTGLTVTTGSWSPVRAARMST